MSRLHTRYTLCPCLTLYEVKPLYNWQTNHSDCAEALSNIKDDDKNLSLSEKFK